MSGLLGIVEDILFCLWFAALGLVVLYMSARLVFLAWFTTKREFKE